ncbi:DUF2501 domain-containing protein [Erwiniaceae bacterium BAC15a-03b]|uniref:DUF2501 domain-containing protein n=1 Tax=Winslowiella arboricola TaxID=2978220 RepID=A0A9J6PUG3_9GAMM|nr:DUF2501 domain-containing protein [Winslowiella arboricola]MCU5773697.1 DUF2501 domain-containing protein [Winslowiella arboricola]MCU5778404.1 DUF2501 domain-containing protein [Winslowiella arboricola]
MNKSTQRVLLALSISSALLAGNAAAASWQDQLNSAASQLGQQNNSNTTSNSSQSGTSLSSLSGLLTGGDKAVSANSMTNAAGVLEYCVKNNVVDNNVASVKNQVLDKLGLNTQQEKTQQTDYQQGLMGLLNTGNGQQLNLKSLGDTEMGKKVKTKACDVVLKQGKNFIS